jgi:hypothetical protein
MVRAAINPISKSTTKSSVMVTPKYGQYFALFSRAFRTRWAVYRANWSTFPIQHFPKIWYQKSGNIFPVKESMAAQKRLIDRLIIHVGRNVIP